MKYLLAIVGIIGAVTLATLVIIWPEQEPPEQEVVLQVNDRKLTSTMIDQSPRHRSSHHEDRDDFLNSVAVEQVLIQEAQRRKIDKEPAFRQAIKDYYEQSLIKILIDRELQTIDSQVSEAEIDTFLGYYGRTVSFTRVRGQGTPADPRIDWSQGETTSELFDNLSNSLQAVLAGLEPGGTDIVFDTGNEWFAVRFDSVSEPKPNGSPAAPKELIRDLISDHKRQQQLNRWINRLITTADISIKEESN